jgi:hypothetical protein
LELFIDVELLRANGPAVRRQETITPTGLTTAPQQPGNSVASIDSDGQKIFGVKDIYANNN